MNRQIYPILAFLLALTAGTLVPEIRAGEMDRSAGQTTPQIAQSSDPNKGHTDDGPSDHASDGAKHGTSEGKHGGGDDSGWKTLWKPALTQLLGFLLLIAVYTIWVHPLLKETHRDRRDRIQSRLDRIEQEREEIDEREREIEQKMNSIEERAREKRDEILERGRQLKQETIEEAKAYADETVENARNEAERIRKRAIMEMQNEMTRSALDAVRRYFREESGTDLHEEFQRNFLEALEEADSIEQFQRGAGNGYSSKST